MTRALLIQLPIPQLRLGLQTANIPLAAACLHQAAAELPGVSVEILPESVASYLGDAALLEHIRSKAPEIVGFTVYCWNVDRVLDLCRMLKNRNGPRIVIGGPEVTQDNPRIRSPYVDFTVYGDGECLFRSLLADPGRWDARSGTGCNEENRFAAAPSPYAAGWLEPEIENLLLVETQRGCPYSCGYCYYNQSRKRMEYKDRERVLEAVRWAVDHGVGEVFLLDPSFNARPDFEELIRQISRINHKNPVSILGEIRADALETHQVGKLAEAGITWLEAGLQSTNRRAQEIMRRKTDLARFAEVTAAMRTAGIVPGVDLIAGLPGDDPEGFHRSLTFVAEHGLDGDVQVFPLSVLPGTAFRRQAGVLGLDYEASPPYAVRSTPTFSEAGLVEAFEAAESMFDVTLYPLPDVEVSYRHGGKGEDAVVSIGGKPIVHKLFLFHPRPLEEIECAAGRLAHPYQLLVGPGVADGAYLSRVLSIVTAANVYTPLEVVFFDPPVLPDADALLEAVRLNRPHFLDIDLRFQFPEPGNRAAWFTIVSAYGMPLFQGPARRHVFWWKETTPPDRKTLTNLLAWDGVLVDGFPSTRAVRKFQDRMAPRAEELPALAFADLSHQIRWLGLVSAEDYWLGLFR